MSKKIHIQNIVIVFTEEQIIKIFLFNKTSKNIIFI